MIYALMSWLLSLGVHVPTVLTYTSTRMGCAAVTSLLISIFVGPYFIKRLYEWKIGQSIRTDECPLLGELHAKKKDTPTMGGVLILFSMVCSLLLWMDLSHPFTWILLGATVVLGTIGGIDDYLKLRYKNTKGLSPQKKLLGQFAFSGLVALYLFYPPLSEGIWLSPPVAKETVRVKGEMVVQELSLKDYASRLYVPFVKKPIPLFTGAFVILGILFTMLVITGSSNAVNLTDGLDGLAAGCLLIASSSLALIAFISNNIEFASFLRILYIEGSGEIAIYLAALCGGCLGFLWYNAHPAQVFMGDTGSLALGGVIGVSAVLLKRELLLVIIGGIFVAEAVSVILQVLSYRFRDKKRIFLCAPLHHHFEYKGWAETKVVIRFWIIALLLAIVGVVSLKFQ